MNPIDPPLPEGYKDGQTEEHVTKKNYHPVKDKSSFHIVYILIKQQNNI